MPTLRPVQTLLLTVILSVLAEAAEGPSTAATFAVVTAPDAAAVADLFASGDPGRIAWAAYHAGRLRLAGSMPDLLAHLGPAADPGPVERAVSRACAAALVDLKVPVEVGVPERLQRAGAAAEAVILAAADPGRHRDWLLQRVGEGPFAGLDWMVAVHLLAAERSPAVCSRLLGGLEPVLTIQVFEPHRRSVTRGCGVRTIKLVRRQGFPPVVAWELRDREGDGGMALAAGPKAVWSVRREGDLVVLPAGGDIRVQEYRAQLLYHLSPETLPSPPEGAATVQVSWRGRGAFIDEAARLQAGHQARWRDLVRALEVAGLLPVGTSVPRMALRIEDHRRGVNPPPLADERQPQPKATATEAAAVEQRQDPAEF